MAKEAHKYHPVLRRVLVGFVLFSPLAALTNREEVVSKPTTKIQKKIVRAPAATSKQIGHDKKPVELNRPVLK